MVAFQTRQLSEALLAVTGIWLLVRQMPDYAVSSYMIWSQPSWAQVPDAPNVLVIQGMHFLVSALIGLVLLFGRKPISRWLGLGQSANEAGSGALIAIGAAVIGVFFVADGGVTLGTYYATLEQSESTGQMLGSNRPRMFWDAWFSVGTGVLLFAVSVGLGRLWLLLRGRADLGE